jgi:hypothetical protein
VRLTTKKIHHSETKCLPRINIFCTGDPQRIQLFVGTLSEKISADNPNRSDVDSSWRILMGIIYTSELAAFGKREHRNASWNEAHWAEMQPVTETKMEALLAYKQNPCPNTLDKLRAARNKAQ